MTAAATPTAVHPVTALLTQLGTTADQVADRLRTLEITGRRNSSDDCPIARWLRRSNTAFIGIEVSPEEIALLIDTGDADETYEYPIPPEPVADFITSFDAGVYPDLVDGGEQR